MLEFRTSSYKKGHEGKGGGMGSVREGGQGGGGGASVSNNMASPLKQTFQLQERECYVCDRYKMYIIQV